MIRRPLVIAVYEPRWFIRVIDILRNRRINYTVYDRPENLPYYSVLYTDYEEFVREASIREDIKIIYDPNDSLRGLEESILATMFKTEYREVSIGIDPGNKPYIVVIGDGEILYHGYVSLDKVSDQILMYLSSIPAHRRIVRVGAGYNGLEIATKLRRKININIEIVDEYETTPRSNRSSQTSSLNKKLLEILKPYRNKDAYAALRIALRKGIRVD
ncbi:hypothetical protein Smar_0619 [Staphylothermus marinus F1]|uniref:Uncharacterized protein n=1 Tax=Staphylothermus marinus (strain ATCC 43588 / DSM 3639 / JCM 9404 / F1) TaxID=399550 RepID=A3DM66_STAMF|nr:hypothetical protein [Staphylothermus marinus]ABN69726.1 hypothetical protein Smar_0619 [Staphylothermus marinus F1]